MLHQGIISPLSRDLKNGKFKSGSPLSGNANLLKVISISLIAGVLIFVALTKMS